jgi:acyl-CoA dehydrogenase
MSVSVAGVLQAGGDATVKASIVKDLGTLWEQELPSKVRNLCAFMERKAGEVSVIDELLAFALKTAPKFTIQGGTTEVLRGIIARELGLR